MTEPQRKRRNALMLSECSDWFAERASAIIRDLEGHGFRPRIQCAWRSPTEQLKAYKDGFSQLKFGLHNITRNDLPWGFAADILDDDHPLQPGPKYLLMLASSAQPHGCQTGIEWGLSASRRIAIKAAIRARAWNFAGAWGWDPTHVEAVGITATQAQAGKLPR